MGALAKAVQLLLSLTAAARPTASIPWTRIPAGLFLGGTCFALLMTAAGFLLAAAYLWLEPHWGPAGAAFGVGFALLPIAGFVGFSLYRLITRPMDRGPGLDIFDLTDEAARGVAAAEDWVSQRPLTATGGAVLLGALTALMLTQRRRRY